MATQSGWPELHILTLAATFPGREAFIGQWGRCGYGRGRQRQRHGGTGGWGTRGTRGSQTEDTEAELTIHMVHRQTRHTASDHRQCEEQ